jgi:hypothetical protein
MMQVRSLVGYTSSQKPIYRYDATDIRELSQDISAFSNEDCFDALAVFHYLQLVYWRRFGPHSKEYTDSVIMTDLYDDRISEEFMKKRKAELHLTTAFDVSNYGRKHCVPYLQELIGS